MFTPLLPMQFLLDRLLPPPLSTALEKGKDMIRTARPATTSTPRTAGTDDRVPTWDYDRILEDLVNDELRKLEPPSRKLPNPRVYASRLSV
jgi:hypothetical protein